MFVSMCRLEAAAHSRYVDWACAQRRCMHRAAPVHISACVTCHMHVHTRFMHLPYAPAHAPAHVQYLSVHQRIAAGAKKPLIMEEYGLILP